MRLISRNKPDSETLKRILDEQAKLDFSYPEVGTTGSTTPAGYVVDRTHLILGRGDQIYTSAKLALQSWKQFRLGWVDVFPYDAPLVEGTCVAVVGRAFGLWWVNCCRIIYTVDTSAHGSRFGFGYGTLPGHIAYGEECFFIDWDPETDEVKFEILAFSKPNYLVARIGYPWVRRAQKRFGRESAMAIYRAIGDSTQTPSISQFAK